MEDKPMFINKGEMISDPQYFSWIEDLKKRYQSAQVKAAVSVNKEMLNFYWSLGRDVVTLKAEKKCGTGVLQQVSLDLRTAFPKSTGFFYTNIKRMAKWYRFYFQELTIRPQVGVEFKDLFVTNVQEEYESLIRPQVGVELRMPDLFSKIPFRHHIEILATAKSIEEAIFYKRLMHNAKFRYPASVAEIYFDQGKG